MAEPDAVMPIGRTDALLGITQAIEAATNLDELLLLALNELTRLFDASGGGVLLLSEEAALVACALPSRPAVAELRLAEQPNLRRVARARQLILLGPGDTLDPFLRERDARAALLVPLVAQNRPIAALFLTNSQPQPFTPANAALARVLASQLAAAIAAFRLNEAADRRTRELATLNDIAAAVTSTLDAHEVYRTVVERVNRYFQVDAGSILLIDEPTGNLRFVMTIEGGEERLAGVIVPMGAGVVGHVAQTGRYEIVHDADSDPRFYRKVSEALGYPTKTILCVPMRVQGRVIGAIELLNKLNGRFTEDDAERLMRMATFIGVAIQNARLFQQVADGRDRLAAILNSTTDGIMMAGNDGIVLSANPQAAELFHTSVLDLPGRSLDGLLAELRASAHNVVTRSWDGPDGIPTQTTEFELGGGTRRFFSYQTLPVRDANGQVYAQLAVFRDISQERAIEQLRDDYTHMLIHDLRAPLTSIMNGVVMVQRGLGGPITDQQRELLGIALDGSQTLLSLVNTLLDIAKMEEGRMTLDIEPLSPYALADAATERLLASARSQQITIEQQLSVGLPPVNADREKIIRVLQNLLDNAIKFSPHGATVTIGAQRNGALSHPDAPQSPPVESTGWLIFWVRDNGPGVPSAYHERIFEKFGQVRGRKARGTGLGLTFCKLVVEAHGGRVWLESAEDAGSVFALALPLADDFARS